MSKRNSYLAGVMVAAFAAVVWFMDPFSLVVLGVASLLWIGLPLALCGVLFFLYVLRSGGSRSPAIVIFRILLGYTCFVALAVPANRLLQEHAVVKAKAYPARVAPLLEAYRKEQGAYPVTLDQLPSKPRVPRLMRQSSYQSKGQSYSFMFSQPGGLIDAWHYDSETQTWRLAT